MLLRALAALALLVLPLVLLAPPAASSSELLRNGGFEQDANLDGAPDGWSGGVFATRGSAARSGQYALQLLLGGTALSDPIPVTAGQTLALVGHARGPAAVAADLVFTDERGGALTTVQTVRAQPGAPGIDAYRPFAAQSVVPMGVTHVRVRLQFEAGLAVGPARPYVLAPSYVDDVSVRRVAGDGSILFNGGVEVNLDGDPSLPDGWSAFCPSPSGFALSTASPRAGQRSMDLTDRHSDEVCSLYSPHAPLAAGTRFAYSVELLVQSGWGVLALETFGSSGLENVAFSAPQAVGTSWVTVSLTDCASATEERGRLRVFSSNVNGPASVTSGTVRFDNARIAPLGPC